QKLVEAVAGMLEIQMAASGRQVLDPLIERRALGYVYGFIDAALRSIGQEMSDVSLGVPVAFHVLRRVFAGKEDFYLQTLIDNVSSDPVMMAGVVHGGQQYADFQLGKLQAPMGLARMQIEQAI